MLSLPPGGFQRTTESGLSSDRAWKTLAMVHSSTRWTTRHRAPSARPTPRRPLVPHMSYIASGTAREGRVAKSAMVRARIEPGLKKQAETMLEQLGLSATTAITMFYRQIVQRRGLPFEVRLPNAATRRAMEAARSGRGVVEANSFDELRNKLEQPRGRRHTLRKSRTSG